MIILLITITCYWISSITLIKTERYIIPKSIFDDLLFRALLYDACNLIYARPACYICLLHQLSTTTFTPIFHNKFLQQIFTTNSHNNRAIPCPHYPLLWKASPWTDTVTTTHWNTRQIYPCPHRPDKKWLFELMRQVLIILISIPVQPGTQNLSAHLKTQAGVVRP